MFEIYRNAYKIVCRQTLLNVKVLSCLSYDICLCIVLVVYQTLKDVKRQLLAFSMVYVSNEIYFKAQKCK